MALKQQFCGLLLVALACWYDLRTRHIPNLLTFGGAGVALVFASYSLGARGLLTGVEGWLVGLLLFLPFYALGGLGAGDVKLLASVGAWQGPAVVCWAAVYAALAGGVMAVALALATGYLNQAIVNIWALLAFWRTGGVRPMPALTLSGGSGPRLAYAVPIAAGTLAAMWWR